MKPKKYAAFLTAFLLLAATAPCDTNSVAVRPTVAFAEEEAQIIDSGSLCETITWELDSAGTLTITGSGDMSEITNTFSSQKNKIKKVIIKNTDAENTITAIAAGLFNGYSALEEVSLPDTIKVIGNEAFKGTGLTELTLPGCELGFQSFAYSALKSVTIGEGTETLPQECFRECTALESVYLPDSIKDISGGYDYQGSFFKCSALKKVSIGTGIETINQFAFHTMGEELEIEFRDGVTVVPASAFYERKELTKVILPESLKSVDNYAFRSCSNLSECNFPSSLEKIGKEAFRGTGLTSLTLPGCELDFQSFAYSALKSVTIGEGTETLPQECFRECTALESVYLPDSIKDISGGYDYEGSFFKCSALKKVSIGTGIETINQFAFHTMGEELEVIFREGATVVPENAFNGRKELTKLVLPETLKKIGDNALKGCSSLELICIQSTDCEIPASETAIPSGALIRSYENSTAQEYAKEYGRNFETFNEDDPVIAYGNQIKGVSLTLDGKIGVNFFATLNSKATRVILSGPNGNVEYKGDKLAAAKQNDGVYCFAYGVNAIQAGEKITLKIYNARGKQLDIYNSSFEKDSDKTIEYSVNDYIANATQYKNDEKLKAMVTALDNYCKAAENYFIKGNHTLNIPDANVVKTNDFKKKFEISLVLNSGTALRIYSNAANAVRINGANEIPLTATTVDKDTKYYEISDITAFNLLNDVTVKLDGTTYKICPTDYCTLILGKSNDKKLRDVCNALYYYGAAAQAYGNSIQQ